MLEISDLGGWLENVVGKGVELFRNCHSYLTWCFGFGSY
jgi:hypothetical protein